MSAHPFDAALTLREIGPGRYAGRTSPAYWNMVGPFGGITAAIVLRAVLLHPQLLGEPMSLTVNYAGAMVEGPFEVQVQPVRTNRTTQHWTVGILQNNDQGQPLITTTATLITALRRETWRMSDIPMPEVPTPQEVPQGSYGDDLVWLKRYQLRLVSGGIPREWHGGGDDSLTRVWMQDQPARPLDFCALAALADVFFSAHLAQACHPGASRHSVDHHLFPCQCAGVGRDRDRLGARSGAGAGIPPRVF